MRRLVRPGTPGVPRSVCVAASYVSQAGRGEPSAKVTAYDSAAPSWLLVNKPCGICQTSSSLAYTPHHPGLPDTCGTPDKSTLSLPLLPSACVHSVPARLPYRSYSTVSRLPWPSSLYRL
ncbi:hypothetical protein GCM10027277_07900 [Pseudoduganella ginsengisoli]